MKTSTSTAALSAPDGHPTAPRRRTALRLCAWTAALWCAALPPARGAALELPAVMALLAQHKTGEARFTEERFIAGLDTPLRSSGRLTFAAPDRFARHTLEPRAESMEVQGNDVLLKRGGRSRRMSLDTVPEMAALVDALRGTLNGDATILARHFRSRVGGEPALWTLVLTPIDERLGRALRELQITGARGELRSIDVLLTGGDRSTMLIEPIASPVPGTPASPGR